MICEYCNRDVSRTADVRYCAVCKDAGRIPAPETSDDAPIQEDLLKALKLPVMLAEEIAVVKSKSRMKREAVQKRPTPRKRVRIPVKKAKKKKK